MIYSADLKTPLGNLVIEANSDYILRIDCGARKKPAATSNELCDLAVMQLRDYFAGQRLEFSLPYSLAITDFQRRVLEKVADVPYGETKTYGEIAREVRNPRAARAVGLANRNNPLAILIPCHRIVGANGKLTGYATGIEKKEWLLAHEARTAAHHPVDKAA